VCFKIFPVKFTWSSTLHWLTCQLSVLIFSVVTAMQMETRFPKSISKSAANGYISNLIRYVQVHS
jgi:FtsH-binding integral membrane protein